MAKKDLTAKQRAMLATPTAPIVDGVRIEDELVEVPLADLGMLRANGYVMAEAVRDGKTVIVTKGGVKLTFPGDEQRLATLTPEQLDGGVRAKPANRVFGERAGK